MRPRVSLTSAPPRQQPAAGATPCTPPPTTAVAVPQLCRSSGSPLYNPFHQRAHTSHAPHQSTYHARRRAGHRPHSPRHIETPPPTRPLPPRPAGAQWLATLAPRGRLRRHCRRRRPPSTAVPHLGQPRCHRRSPPHPLPRQLPPHLPPPLDCNRTPVDAIDATPPRRRSRTPAAATVPPFPPTTSANPNVRHLRLCVAAPLATAAATTTNQPARGKRPPWRRQLPHPAGGGGRTLRWGLRAAAAPPVRGGWSPRRRAPAGVLWRGRWRRRRPVDLPRPSLASFLWCCWFLPWRRRGFTVGTARGDRRAAALPHRRHLFPPPSPSMACRAFVPAHRAAGASIPQRDADDPEREHIGKKKNSLQD